MRRIVEINRNTHEFEFLKISGKNLKQFLGKYIQKLTKEWGTTVHGY